jgi:hypothetical protein
LIPEFRNIRNGLTESTNLVIYVDDINWCKTVKPLFTVTFVLLLLSGSVGFPVFAQTPQPSTVVADRNDKEIELIKEEYKNLKEQNKDMMSRLENERKGHYEFVEKTYSEIQRVFYLTIVILSGLVAFIGWKTQKDLQDQIKEFSGIAAKKLESEFTEIIKINGQNIQNKFLDLRQVVDSYTGYRNKKILIVGDRNQIESINDSIIRLKQKRFQYINPVEESKFDTLNFNYNDYDLIIYLFKERDPNLPAEPNQPQDSNLLTILALLKGSNIPVILYAPNNTRVPTFILQQYEWILPVNSQITLMNGIFTVSNLLQDRTQP